MISVQPRRFHKKPEIVTAIRWTGENSDAVQDFLHGGDQFSADGWVKGRYVEIGTRKGLAIASVGDWIIRGAQRECYPCKPAIFTMHYEELRNDLKRLDSSPLAEQQL